VGADDNQRMSVGASLQLSIAVALFTNKAEYFSGGVEAHVDNAEGRP